MSTLKNLTLSTISIMLISCSSSKSETAETAETLVKVPETTISVDKKTPVVVPIPMDKEPPAGPAASTLSLSFTPTKVFKFNWVAVPDATLYKLQEAVTSGSGYTLVKETTGTSFDHVVPLYARLNAKYILQSCNAAGGCTASAEVFTSARVANMTSSIGYFKASNTGGSDAFGRSVSLSDDGNTLAVGASSEASNSNMINNEGEDSNSTLGTGAVYVFTRNNTSAGWSQQAYLKASNAGGGDHFGRSVSLSEDGNTLVVGAEAEGSSAKGTNASEADKENGDALNSGAAYVFIRTGAGTDDVMWSEQAYLKASNTDGGDNFGTSVSLSDDGNTLAVSSPTEKSSAMWSNSSAIPRLAQNNNGTTQAGAVYVFIRTGAGTDADPVRWSQQAYLKATNTQEYAKFGFSVSLNDDGTTLAVGASGPGEGEVFVFIRTVVSSDTTWSYQALLKATNKEYNDKFGSSVSISADGNTLAVGATGEDSSATGISIPNPDNAHDNDGTIASGAAYVFLRTGAGTDTDPVMWSQQAYLKASNPDVFDYFGNSISISADGNTLAVGAYSEDSGATGINNEDDGNVATPGLEETNTGAVYTFTRSGTTWSPQAYIKANNTDEDDEFGYSLALSADGGTLAVGAKNEGSNAIGVNEGDKDNNDAGDAGAVYLY